MTFYLSLSIINMIALVTVQVLMIRILIKYEIPRSWHKFLFLTFAVTFLFLLGQAYTILHPGNSKVIVKLVVTLYCYKTFEFCKAIKSVSMLKKNFYKNN
jgi:hypothetical protein